MALSAAEYKEALLYRLNNEARLAEAEAAFNTQELQYAETVGIWGALDARASEAQARADWIRSVIPAIEDVDLV